MKTLEKDIKDMAKIICQISNQGGVIENVHIVDHIVKTPTEYMQAKRLSKESIPKGEDHENWITLRDPKTKKKLYSKVPQYKRKTDYEYEMKNKISSDRPALPLIIEKIRVIHKSELENEKMCSEGAKKTCTHTLNVYLSVGKSKGVIR